MATEYDREKIELIKRTVCRDATDDELDLFVAVCKRTGLDPFARQIYAIKRWDSATKSNRVVFQTSIDGYRLTADRSGRYVPGPRPTFTYDDKGRVVSAVASVMKQTADGKWHTIEAEAFFSEYVGTNKEGVPTKMWSEKPHVMISKCAEALALRKAFPAELSGVYTHDEMGDDTPAALTTQPKAKEITAPADVDTTADEAALRAAALIGRPALMLAASAVGKKHTKGTPSFARIGALFHELDDEIRAAPKPDVLPSSAPVDGEVTP